MRRITDPAALEAYRLKYVQAYTSTANKIKAKRGDAVAYVWTNERGRPRAVAWLGRSQNPYSGSSTQVGSAYSFKNTENRRSWIAGLIERAEYAAKRKADTDAANAARRAGGHQLTVGSVLRCSWGYEQTNVDYYQVTALAGKSIVEVREIAQERHYSTDMTGDCVPLPGSFKGAPKRYKVSTQGDSIKISSYATAFLEQPTEVSPGLIVYKPSHWTSYA